MVGGCRREPGRDQSETERGHVLPRTSGEKRETQEDGRQGMEPAAAGRGTGGWREEKTGNKRGCRQC